MVVRIGRGQNAMAVCFVLVKFFVLFGKDGRAYSVFSFKSIGNETGESTLKLSNFTFGTARMCK